jgi:TonB-dependent starch-binding outer membrane protein SusC
LKQSFQKCCFTKALLSYIHTIFISISITNQIYFFPTNKPNNQMKRKLLMSFGLVFGLLWHTLAQDRVVTGKVTSAEDGSGLPGVSVSVKGTTKGTSTDGSGTYKISVPNNATLTFSFVGFNNVNQVVGSRTAIDVALQPNVTDLNEIVVVGYGTQSTRNLTTSVSKIDSKQMANRPLTGLDQAMQGAAAGVNVTNSSGTPGGGVSVNIRGIGSITGSSQPLYVVDGVPLNTGSYARLGFGNQQTSALNDIAPSDIESIDILKDASAAAIYGSQASNGVVLITTKRGKAGKTQFTFDTYYGVAETWKAGTGISGAEEVKLLQEMVINRYATPVAGGTFTTPAFTGTGQWASQADFAAYFFGANAGTNTVNGQLVVAESPIDVAKGIRTKAIFSDPNLAANTNWQKEVFQSAITKNYDLGIRGGNEKTRFALTTSLYDQQGIVIGSTYKRFSGRLNVDHTISPKLTVGTNLAFSRTWQDRVNNDNNIYGVVSAAFLMASDIPVRFSDGSYGKDASSSVDNPLASAIEPYNLTKNGRLIGNLFGEYKIINGLTFRTSVNIDYINYGEARFLPTTTNQGVGVNGSGTETASSEQNWTWSSFFTYTKSFGDHNLKLLAGADYQESAYEAIDATATGFPGNAIRRLSAGATKSDASSTGTSWGLTSYYGRANYDYKDKYLLTAILRTDGSSRFGANNRWGLFPSVSAAWRMSKEPFMQNVTAINDLKLRVSYGSNGNSSGIGNFASLGLSGSSNIAYAGGGGLAPTQLSNPDLKWETNTSTGIGVDVALLNNRVRFTFDYYKRTTNDLLLNVNIPATSGFNTVAKNIGSIDNQGLEFSLGLTPVKTKDITWDATLNISRNTNKVTSLGGAPKFAAGFGNWVEEGYPLGTFRGYRNDGIFQNVDEVNASLQKATAKPGDIRYKDVDGNGVFNSNDQEILGNALPSFIGGFDNNVTFGGFDFRLFFQFTQGNTLLNYTKFFAEGMNGVFGQTQGVLNRWTPTNTNTNVPRAVWGDPSGNRRVSERFLEDGSYIRLKTVSLGYNLPKSIIQKIKLDKVRIYVQGQNLWTATKYSGLDPEVNTFNTSNTALGTDFLTFPQPRTYTIGLNIGF